MVICRLTPYLELNTTPARTATYLSGSGTDTLKFAYTIIEGDSTDGELDYLDTESLKLGEDGSIKDAVGYEAVLTLPWSNSWFSEGGDLKKKYIKIDAITPAWEENSTLEASNIGENSLTLTWSKTATDNVKVTAYNIYQDNELIGKVEGTYTDLSTTYNVTNLASGTEYSFRVEALDAAGNESSGGPTTTATTTSTVPEEDNQAPVWVEGSQLEVGEIGIHDLFLYWNKEDVSDNVMVTGFNIYQNGNPIASVDSNTTNYRVTELKSFTSYTFQVQAVDAAGNESTNGPIVETKTEIPDLIVQGTKVNEELEYLMNDLINLESDENFPPSSGAPVIRQKYSSVNNYGTSKNYAAEGIRVSYLLDEAEVESGYGKVIFYTIDGESLLLTEEQINEERFYFSVLGEEPILVEPILAYQSSSGSAGEPDFAQMTMHYPRLFFGQKTANEITNSYYLKDIIRVVVGDATGEPEDTEQPTWPEGSKLEVSDITDTSLTISWTPAKDKVGVTEYWIFKDEKLITTVSGLASFYNVTGLTANTEYTFKVEAGDAAGNWSTDGPAVTVTTANTSPAKDTEAPIWESGTLSVSGVASTELTLTWTGAKDNVGVTKYRIFKDTKLIVTLEGTVFSYTITDLKPNTSYTIKVEAGDAAGNWSTDGPAVDTTTSPGTSAKINLNLSKTGGTVGETVTAHGVSEPDRWVAIRVIDSKDDIVVFDTVKSDAKGNYTCTFKIPNVSPGNLIVIVGYEKEVAMANLEVQTSGSESPGGGPRGGGGPSTPDTVTVGGTSVDKETSTVDGKTVETFTIKEDVTRQIKDARAKGADTVNIHVPASNTATTVMQVPNQVLNSAEGMNVNISSRNISLELPQTLVDALAKSGQDLNITIERGTVSEASAALSGVEGTEGARVLGAPTHINTAIKGNTNITLPLEGITVPTDPAAQKAFLDSLAVFAVHSDNSKEVIQGTIVYEGNKPVGITFTVDRFSMFAIVKLEDESVTPVKPTTPVVTLTDISGHWAQANIQKLVEAGAISGYPDKTFKPDANITRAEFAVTLVKALNLAPKSGKVFNDTANHWAKDFIATAQAYRIISGYSDTLFGPEDKITREQMAVMVVKAANLIASENTMTFTDSSDVSAWSQDAVIAASSNGIMSGYPDGSFKPQANATRAEAVTVIVKILKR